MIYQITFRNLVGLWASYAAVDLELPIIILEIPFDSHLCLILFPGSHVFLFFGLLIPSFSWITFSNNFLRKDAQEKSFLRFSILNFSLSSHLTLAECRI